MTPQDAGLLAALSTIGIWICLAAWLVLAPFRLGTAPSDLFVRYDGLLRRYGLHVGALIGVGSVVGSLYFSEVAHYTPCWLCWTQRIFIFPLPVLLLVAIGSGDRGVFRYILPLAGIGAVFSLWNIGVQWFPDSIGAACGAQADCAKEWVNAFGFITFPLMALTTEVSVAFLAWAASRRAPADTDVPPDSAPM